MAKDKIIKLKPAEAEKTVKNSRRGPEPERFKIDGYANNWKDAVKVALRKKKPARGWPKA